jgi:hypothetical protein
LVDGQRVDGAVDLGPASGGEDGDGGENAGGGAEVAHGGVTVTWGKRASFL